jgi:RNA polymerase sigma-70 factor (ECF subfamily)
VTDPARAGHPRCVDWTSPACVPMTHDVKQPEALSALLVIDDIFRAHASFVHRVLKRLDVPSADLDDALQEVFLVVARKLPTYDERDALKAWLFTIARQVALHAKRSHQRNQGRKERAAREAEQHPLLMGPGPEEELARRQDAALAQHFLDKLAPEQAMVFYLAEVEGFTAPEIAASLEIKLNTVYARLRLSRARIEAWARRATSFGGER